MSIDAGDRWTEYEIKEREEIGSYMYEHQDDYVSRSRYEKKIDQLDKAKELLERFMKFYERIARECYSKDFQKTLVDFYERIARECYSKDFQKTLVDTEQFLSEVEK